VTSSKAGKKRKADIKKAQEMYEEKKRNKRLQAALTDTMRALPSTQETFKNFTYAFCMDPMNALVRGTIVPN